MLAIPFRESCEPDRAHLTQQILDLDPWEAEGYVDAQMPPLVDAVCDLSTLWEKGDCDALPGALDRVKTCGMNLSLLRVGQVIEDVFTCLENGDEAGLSATMARLFRLLEAGFDSFSRP